jgi:hypothetical protein
LQAYKYAKELVTVLSVISAYFAFSEHCVEFFKTDINGLKPELEGTAVQQIGMHEVTENENRAGYLPGRRKN